MPPPPPPPVTIPASVSGYVYRDTYDTNGQRQPEQGETGIVGVTVTLTGVDLDGNPIAPLTTFTDATGFYEFRNLVPGSYTITETQPVGWIDGLDTPGSLGGSTPSNDVLIVSLAAGDNGIEYNFGEILRAAVFGFVWHDLNRNGLFDYGQEPPIPGVTVTISGTAFAGGPMARPLTASDSPVGLTAVTDANGRWEFPDLPPGLYDIVETQPFPYLDFLEANQEANPGPVDIGNDVFANVLLRGGDLRGPLNYGEVLPDSDTDLTKREFLGSTPVGPGGQLPGPTPPITVPGQELSQVPTYGNLTPRAGAPALFATAAGAGRAPLVRVFDYSSQTERFRFYAYEPSFTGGVRVAVGDVDGDGIDDIVTATGIGGGPRIRVFSGATGEPVADYFAYEPDFRGGVFVTLGDVNGDGKMDIITGTEIGGGPRITIFDGATGAILNNFFAFDESQRGGVRIATADFNNDGRDDLVTTTGNGVPTRVRVFDLNTGAIITDYAPYTPDFTGGVFIAAGDFNGDGTPDIATGADVGGGPHVQIFNGLSSDVLNSFFAYEESFTGGVRLAMRDLTGDGVAEVITGPGIGRSTAIRVLQGGTLAQIDEFNAFDATYAGGVFVG